MGVKQIFFDDWTGDELDYTPEVTTVTVDGESYEVHLSSSSKESFLQFLQGNLTPGVSAPSGKRTYAKRKDLNTYGYDVKDVREWAIESNVLNSNGTPVGSKGRLSQGIYDAYNIVQKNKKKR